MKKQLRPEWRRPWNEECLSPLYQTLKSLQRQVDYDHLQLNDLSQELEEKANDHQLELEQTMERANEVIQKMKIRIATLETQLMGKENDIRKIHEDKKTMMKKFEEELFAKDKKIDALQVRLDSFEGDSRLLKFKLINLEQMNKENCKKLQEKEVEKDVLKQKLSIREMELRQYEENIERSKNIFDNHKKLVHEELDKFIEDLNVTRNELHGVKAFQLQSELQLTDVQNTLINCQRSLLSSQASPFSTTSPNENDNNLIIINNLRNDFENNQQAVYEITKEIHTNRAKIDTIHRNIQYLTRNTTRKSKSLSEHHHICNNLNDSNNSTNSSMLTLMSPQMKQLESEIDEINRYINDIDDKVSLLMRKQKHHFNSFEILSSEYEDFQDKMTETLKDYEQVINNSNYTKNLRAPVVTARITVKNGKIHPHSLGPIGTISEVNRSKRQ